MSKAQEERYEIVSFQEFSASTLCTCSQCRLFTHEPGSKLLVLGMVIQPLIGNPYNGYINPYYWVDDHPLLYGNNGSLDPSTHGHVENKGVFSWNQGIAESILFQSQTLMAIVNQPPRAAYPPQFDKGLIRPYIFLGGGGTWPGGRWLTSHEFLTPPKKFTKIKAPV